MSAGLMRKEFRGQWPILFLGIALLVIDVWEVLAEPWNLQLLSVTYYTFYSFCVFQFVVSFAIGSGLLMREIDDGSLAFLDGLPLTRARTFAVKLLTAAMVLLCYPLGNLVLFALFHLTARESLDHDLHLSLLADMFALDIVLTLVGLVCGMLLGFLRSLAWMALALLVIVIKLLSDRYPRMSVLNPIEALTINLAGPHFKWPVEGITMQCGVILLFGFAAFWLFKTAGADRRRLQLYLSRPLISALVVIATIAALIAALMVYARSHRDEGVREVAARVPNAALFTPAAPGHAQTLHYTFSYPALQAEAVQALLLHADEVFDDVAKIIGIDGGASIDVDLSGSEANTEGTAFFDRIRMFASAQAPLDVLAHETTHVFATRLAGGKNERELRKLDAFNEGLAHWVEQAWSAKSGVCKLDRLQAVMVSQRHMFDARQLTDMSALARDVDQNLKYPLGAIIVDALIRRYGGDAPKRLLLTLGRSDFPRDLEGYSLWQAAFQLSGFDLTLVFDDYAQLVKSWQNESAAFIADLPRPRGSLLRNDEQVGVLVHVDAKLPSGWRTVVRFRPRTESPLRDYATRFTREGIAWRSVDSIAKQMVCFQPGIMSSGIAIYEAWTCLPLDSAQLTNTAP